MDRVHDVLRSGAWLTRERIRLVAIAVLFASGVGLIYLLVTANGLVDIQGRPLGTDFSSFYAAGTHVLDGHPDAPYDLSRQYAREQAMFGAATPFYGWLYPPFFLFIAAALALLPYGAALAAWQAATLGFYLLAIRAILAATQPPIAPDRRRFRQQAVDLRPALAPARARLPRCSGQRRSRPERLAHRGARWWRARHARPQTDRRRHPVRPHGL